MFTICGEKEIFLAIGNESARLEKIELNFSDRAHSLVYSSQNLFFAADGKHVSPTIIGYI